MKNTLRISALFLASALLFSCQKESAVVDPVNTDNSNARIRTFTCTIASNSDSKVSIDGVGKTAWQAGDEIMIHGGTDGHDRLKITLAAGDISADGKQATISFSEADLAPYIHSNTDILSHYYAQYPASSVPDGNMYYDCCFINTNNFLMAACDVDDTFVFYNLCSVLSYTVSGDFDKVAFFGNNGEKVGYDYYQVRVRNDKGGMSVNYHKPGNGFSSYNEQNIIIDNSLVTDETTVNYLSFPNGANFTNGFTFIFYKNGVGVKTVSTHTPVNLAREDFLPLGSITSHLKDYTPTYTVVGDNMAIFGSEWNTFAADNVMTDNGDGTYSKSYNVPAGSYNFKIVKDHSYDLGQWPYDHNQNYVAAKAGKLTIKFNPSDNSITFGFVEAATYTVAGDNTTIFGTAWDQNNADNEMTLQADDTFVWSKKITGLTAALPIEFKVVKNHNWDDAWPASNKEYTIPSDGTLYIFFNPTNGDVTTWFVPKITIDGDYSDWSTVGGTETSSAICKWMKAISDEDNYYIYLVSDATLRALTESYSYSSGYYYLDFDLDNNPDTGSRTDDEGRKFEAFTYIRLFKSDGTTITINDAPYVSTSNGVSSSGIEVAGSVDGGLMYFEIKIPRANMPAVNSGQTIRILSWRSKGGSVIEYTFDVA